MVGDETHRIGILGGTFNPIHLGHLILAERAREELDLERLYLLPSGEPPHKRGPELAPAADRLEMARLGALGNPGLEALDIEVRRSGTTYTIDTLRELHRRIENPTVYFLVGADSVPELPTWKEWERLFGLARFVVLRRPGFDDDGIFEALHDRVPSDVVAEMRRRQLATPHIEISSTEIRDRVADGRSIRYLVPDAVREYIAAHELYAAPAD